MKYVATLNGKKYEIEIERVDARMPLDRGAAAVATAPTNAAAPAQSLIGNKILHATQLSQSK